MADTLTNGASPPLFNAFNTIPVAENLDLTELLLERGTTGLRRASGWIKEELLDELAGTRGIRIYKEMRDNSAVVGACLYAIEMLMRKVPWRVEAADDSLLAAEYADFVDGALFQDLDMPWGMLLSEILSFLVFGWSYFEVILKRRQGMTPPLNPDGSQPLPSRFDDGTIGIGKLAQRAQDTLLRWEFDPTGGLLGMHQMDSWIGRQAYLPYEKCLLFRATSWKDNPEGRSILRTAYRSWFMTKHIENVQAIGIERNIAGMPVIGVPPKWLTSYASADELAQLEMAKRIVRNLRQDEQMGVVYPLIYDANNNELFKLSLMASSGSSSTIDTNAVIERYELRITQSMLADLIFLGHEAVGSFALASSKTNILSMALAGYLMAIKDVLNRRLVPLLWRVNAYPEDLMPTLVHGDVESVDLKELGQFIKDYSQSGFNITDLDNHFRMLAELPERDESLFIEPQPAPGQQPQGQDEEDTIVVTKRRQPRIQRVRQPWRGYRSLVAGRRRAA